MKPVPGFRALAREAASRCGRRGDQVRLSTLAAACGVDAKTFAEWRRKAPVRDTPGVRLARHVLRGWVALSTTEPQPDPKTLRAWRDRPASLTVDCLLAGPLTDEELLQLPPSADELEQLEARGQLRMPHAGSHS